VSAVSSDNFSRQHVIDPEICIRCNTCEATCPINAITHDSRNYVVDFAVCNGCGACVPPCPTGAIDNWRNVPRKAPFSLDAQLSWDVLPPVEAIVSSELGDIPQEVRVLTDAASSGQGRVTGAPVSAAEPCLNLYMPSSPAVATVAGNLKLTTEGSSADVRHIVLDFGSASFPVLEGQTIGILPPGLDSAGKPHFVRLYSVASPRDGERSGHNNLALTIKRVTEDHVGNKISGAGSNFMCDLKVGDPVQVVGPYGASFLMPNHPGSSLLMICTGTGSAPMRAMTEYRRRRQDKAEGGELMLFFGARAPEELPYFGPLMKLPKHFIDVNLAFSRVADQPKRYVQDLIRTRADAVMRLIRDENCFIYVCGLKAMEHGVLEAFSDVCREHGADWNVLKSQLLAQHRLHIETY
jgi:benzoyl-CoA 2,3-epoxidase subunit A